MPTVLVLDDDHNLRDLLRFQLERHGYRVLDGADGRIGMELLSKQPVDLLILDLVMPNKEGIETLKEVQRARPALPVIVVSGAFGGLFLETAKKLGAVAALSKPFDCDELLSLIREHITTS